MPADSSRPDRSRYPGTRPFGDSADDRALFFGRDGEGEQIYLRVLSVPLLVQFGRSGLGKTSLLQASLFPRLREKAFLPVMVRFNETSESPTQTVARAIQEASRRDGMELTLGRSESLRELIATTTVWRDDLLLTFVLVFDQFEEVFTLRDGSFRAGLATELAALLSEEKRERREEADSARSSAATPRVDVKVVISLREDFLGALEEFSSAIPGLFHERLRLEPLGEEAASEAIRRPAELSMASQANPFSVGRFEFEPDALTAMIDYLKGNSGVIEPFQLQLLCRHAEAIAARKSTAPGEPVRLSLEDIQGREGFDAVLKNFYKNTLLRIDRGERSTAARLCEEGLLDASGHRLMLEEGQIRRDFHISEQSLTTLSRERLLRRERRLDSAFYEISHDRLAESILRAKRFRFPKKWRRVLWGTAIVAPIILVMAIWWGWSTRRHQERMNNLLGFLLGNFLEDVRDIGRSRMLDEVQSNLNRAGDTSHWNALNRGLALRNDGDIQRTHGSLKEAIERFQAAIEVFESGPDDVQRQREVARTRERLAEALEDRGSVADAGASYEAAVTAWRAVIQDKFSSTRQDCTSLADSLVSSADLWRRLGETQHSFKEMEEALQIISSVLFRYSGGDGCGTGSNAPEPYPDAKALQVLSRIARIRAQILNYREDYEAGAALATEAQRLNPTSVETREYRLVALAWRGNGRLGTPDRALADYRAALAGFDELRLWDPNNQLWQRQRAANQLLIGSAIVACNTGKKRACNPSPELADAEAINWDGIATFRSLSSSDKDNMAWQGDLAWGLQSQAAIMAAAKRNDERLQFLQTATDVMSQIVARNERDSDSVETYGGMLFQKAEALADLNRFAEAKEAAEKSVAVFTRLMTAHSENPGYVADLSAARKSESGVLKKAGDANGAEAERAASAELDQKYQGLIDAVSQRAKDLARSRNNHVNEGADLYKEKGDYAAALAKFKEAEAEGRAYFALMPTRLSGYHELSNIYRWLYLTEDKLNRGKETAVQRNAALRSTQIEALLAPENARKQANEDLVSAWQNLGVFLDANSRPENTLPIVQEQVAAAELLLQSDTHNASYNWGVGNAHCGLGMVRRKSKKDGWEEAIRLGIRQVAKASEIDPKNPNYLGEIGEWHKYLGDELEADGRKEEASTEYKLARRSYQSVLSRFPYDERARKGMADLGQLGSE